MAKTAAERVRLPQQPLQKLPNSPYNNSRPIKSASFSWDDTLRPQGVPNHCQLQWLLSRYALSQRATDSRALVNCSMPVLQINISCKSFLQQNNYLIFCLHCFNEVAGFNSQSEAPTQTREQESAVLPVFEGRQSKRVIPSVFWRVLKATMQSCTSAVGEGSCFSSTVVIERLNCCWKVQSNGRS